MLPTRSLLLASPLVLALSCAAPIGDPVAQKQDGVQGGAVDTGDPAVGLVWIDGGSSSCSGTLIAPDVVLTAGHCLKNSVDAFFTGTGSPVVLFRGVPPDDLERHDVDAQVQHPDYEAGGCPNPTSDLGLIHLAQPITDITPVRYATKPPPAVGTPCRVVGFGRYNDAEEETITKGQKRAGTMTVMSAGSTYVGFEFGDAVADRGDSGGPVLCGGVITATASCHRDGSWPRHRKQYSARVDTAATWIADQVAAWQAL